jgi:hypothetical protein
MQSVIKMNDKVERIATTMKTQQEKIERLTERVIRLETALEIALTGQVVKRPAAPRLGQTNAPQKG